MTALGFIETQGLLAAIEAADAMIKAADVRLLGKNLAGGGLVTITIAGDVSAVKASVDAAATALQRIEGATLVSRHVIARPYEDVSQLIAQATPAIEPETIVPAEVEVEEKTSAPEAPGIEKKSDKDDVVIDAVETLGVEAEPAPDVRPKHYTISELKKTTVSKLRQIALELSDISLTREEIRSATKRKLIEAILNVINR
jgi:microcompartment protein CcmL/EutN